MKLFIYYSLTGNGDTIAKYVFDKGIKIRKVISLEELPKNKILRILSGGYKAMINYCDKINDFDYNIDEYDEILIGTPIWNGRISSPINTILKNLDLSNKKVTFVLYSGDLKSKQAKDYITSNYKDAAIIELKEPKTNIEELSKLD